MNLACQIAPIVGGCEFGFLLVHPMLPPEGLSDATFSSPKDEEAARKAVEDEAARKAAENEAARKAAEEEAARKAAEEEVAKVAAPRRPSHVARCPSAQLFDSGSLIIGV